MEYSLNLELFKLLTLNGEERSSKLCRCQKVVVIRIKLSEVLFEGALVKNFVDSKDNRFDGFVSPCELLDFLAVTMKFFQAELESKFVDVMSQFIVGNTAVKVLVHLPKDLEYLLH